MRIDDFHISYQVRCLEDLQNALAMRYLNDENWFWLHFDNYEEPSMTLAVKGGLATLHYLRKKQDAGFISVGGIVNPEEELDFLMTASGNGFSIRGYRVLPFERAFSAAKEFYISKQLPKCVEWLEL